MTRNPNAKAIVIGMQIHVAIPVSTFVMLMMSKIFIVPNKLLPAYPISLAKEQVQKIGLKYNIGLLNDTKIPERNTKGMIINMGISPASFAFNKAANMSPTPIQNTPSNKYIPKFNNKANIL